MEMFKYIFYSIQSYINQILKFYLGNKLRLTISHRKALFKELSVKTLTTNRCEVSPFKKYIINLEINRVVVFK